MVCSRSIIIELVYALLYFGFPLVFPCVVKLLGIVNQKQVLISTVGICAPADFYLLLQHETQGVGSNSVIGFEQFTLYGVIYGTCTQQIAINRHIAIPQYVFLLAEKIYQHLLLFILIRHYHSTQKGCYK